ncbi:MAG: HNH endonuclease domain-containing protein [Bacteroidota bacterium]|nr:HNH endonuclease domain-containing protein [Bacteroidota bacterium]
MEKILGLDLGTNSIGWAIRDTAEHENQIIDKGVLIFKKGVGQDDKGNEQPMVKVRTESRGRRRNYQAEKYRKYELLECLIETKMCPLTIEELNEWRHYKKGTGRKYPQSKVFHNWLKFDFNGDGKPDFEQFGFSKHENCYLFRWLAISDKPEHIKIFGDNPQLLGRVFYQLVQRRGYNSPDTDDPETKLIEDGRKNQITKEIEVVGVKVIENLIKEKYKTLGAALYWGQKNNELESINHNRIRNRFTYRNYFEDELNLIFKNLGFDKESDFCKKIKKCITWQRPLRSQKGLVGFCTLDAPLKSKTGIYYKPGKKRIPLSHPLYEEFRTWQFMNNLKIEPPKGKNRIEFINEVVFPLFNRSTDFYTKNKKDKSGKITEKGLITKIENAGGKVIAKYENDTDDEDEGAKCIANTFIFKIAKIFGKNWKELLQWNETLSGDEKNGKYLRVEDLWHLVYDAQITKKQTDNLGERIIPILKKHFPIIEFDVKDFDKFPLDKGYASLSASSIRKVLPYLKQGMIYSQAVFIANLENVLGGKLDDETLSLLSNDFNKILNQHKEDKTIYGLVNELISDRLYHNERLCMGDKYVLDDIDKRDIGKKIKDTYESKVWKKKTEEERLNINDEVEKHYQTFFRQPFGAEKSKLFCKIYRIEEKLKELLINKYKADPERIKKYLWHPSEQEKYSPAYVKKDSDGNTYKDETEKEIFFLGDPNPISCGFKNPMAMKTLQILKKHLNYLLQVGKVNSQTKIIVEIARELNDQNKRKAIQLFQGDQKRKRDKYRKLIEEYFNENNTSNRTISEVMLDRYELWEEQTKKCLYCAQPISCSDLMNGTAQLEHTIPAKISNCDELYNLTLAHHTCNATKAKRFPTEWKDNFENIKKNVAFIYAKFKTHEEAWKESYNKARSARDKSGKDTIIQNRHYQKMYMDYWRKKYETFTIEEVTNQFRRQQLTDTQIITKYALPYLRTVFARVEVQKGMATAKFRKIFEIEPKFGEKDRTEHSHHALDAAVLTLIPPPSIRENMMKDYNDAVDNNTMNNYVHPKPKNWDNFHESFITSMKNEIIINHISEDKTLTQSFKYKRRRGEIVKDKNGKPIMQQGATTRGKLHDESIFGIIKMPETEFREGKHRLKITEGKLTFKQNEKRKTKKDLFVVKRVKITDISSFEGLENIIDPNLRDYIKNEISKRMQMQDSPFEKIILQPIYAYGITKDKNQNPIQPIRHLRCLTTWNSAVEIKKVESAFKSKREHKQFTYANNGELPICAIYEWTEKDKIIRELKPITILEMSKAFHFEKKKDYAEHEKIITKGAGKNKVEIVKKLSVILHKKQQVIFYNKNLAELKELYISDKTSFAKRVYTTEKFEEGRIVFKYHLCSLSDKEITVLMEARGFKNGASKIDYDNPFLKLRVSQGALDMAIEGKHFELRRDGEIKWI